MSPSRSASNGNVSNCTSVLFAVNTGLRPDDAGALQFRDVTIVKDDATGEKILEIEVRGKRRVGYCKSMPGAVRPFERLNSRPRPVRIDEAGGEAPTRRRACLSQRI